MKYAKVILDINHPKVDRVFDYTIPTLFLEQYALDVGQRVMVPFGRRNKKTEGYIIGFAEETEIPEGRLKAIVEILDDGIPMFPPTLLSLAEWMRQRCFCTLSLCLQTIMPPGVRTKSLWWVELNEGERTNVSPREHAVIVVLQEHPEGMEESVLEGEVAGCNRTFLRGMDTRGIIRISQRVFRSDYKKEQTFYRLDKRHPLLEATYEKAQKSKQLQGQQAVLEYLWERDGVTLEEMKRELDITPSPVKTLLKKGILLMEKQVVRRDVVGLAALFESKHLTPTAEQAHALTVLRAELRKEEKKPVLLHGITGSGKTEVYMQLIASALKEGRQAIVLVPEISLTPQMMERFASRFGETVSFTHSKLSLGERVDQWRKARDGEISIMIGPRSAIFTPFDHLGVVILDEFHETSYVSETAPKYDAREVAEWLAGKTNALLVLGSATPDVAYYARAKRGVYHLVELTQRTGGGTLPQTKLVDMRRELEEGNRSAFSRELQQAMKENLERGQQTMLFLNRRGFATFVSCRACGHVMKCPDCGISYTYHVRGNDLHCHYCGRREANPTVCPACQSKYIRYFGVGTQKIEDATRELFPQARILRMDFDTTAKKHSYTQMLDAFRSGEADILIGTQMIAKGHDFPKVSLMGILAADLSLNVGGYLSAERTFQLILQASGRAGRSDSSGRVLIQTYQPENYSVQYAAKQDYKGFYEQEIALREAMDYPPFATVLSILITAPKEGDAQQAAEMLFDWISQHKTEEIAVFDPTQAVIQKVKGDFRWHLLLKGADEASVINLARRAVGEAFEKTKKIDQEGIRLFLTLNPTNLE